VSSEAPRTGCFRATNATGAIFLTGFVTPGEANGSAAEEDRPARLDRQGRMFCPLHCLKGAATERPRSLKQGGWLAWPSEPTPVVRSAGWCGAG